MSPVPYTQSLPYVLRDLLNPDPGSGGVGLVVGKVTAIPNTQTLTVSIAGATVTLPKLSSYSAPAVNDPVYVLTSSAISLILGTVK